MKATPDDGSARRGAGRVNGPALRLADLAGRRLAVWGLGRDTTALLQLLRARGLQQTVVVFDDQPPPPTRQRAAPTVVDEGALAALPARWRLALGA